jgi:ribose transport system permease protein
VNPSETGTPSATAAPSAGAPAEAGQAGPSFARRLLTSSTAWTFLIFLLLVAVFAGMRPTQFATPFNIRNIAFDAATFLVLAVGMTYVIITAGIDLSVGSVLIFSGVVSAKLMERMGGVEAGWGVIALGSLAGLLSGLGWGVLNGVLITKTRIPPLIVTLGTLGMALGFAQIMTGGSDVGNVPRRLNTTIGTGLLFDQVPWLVLVAGLVALVGGLVLAFTRFGRHTYAIGSNPEAARRVGVKVDRHLVQVYALSGLLAGVAGVLSLARFATTTIASHSTDNLSAIAAVVLGGTSLFGGIGTVAGSVIGVLIPAVLKNAFVIIGVEPFWQSVAVGAVLIIAVYLDQLRRQAHDRA